MKTLFLILFSTLVLKADPRISSWFTADSGSYARIFETTADETAGNAVTTWDRGQGVQAQSTYAGIHEISSSANWVYLRSTGLASHTMGPWYLNEAKTNLFPNYPANTGVIYRIPRTPTVPANKSGTTLGAAGFYVNGVAMFDNRDAFSYSNSNGTDSSPRNGINGDDVWNRDAYVNESVTFDAGNAHQAGRQYHYHANPPGLRHSLGDSVDYDPSTNTYSENFNGSHSPILAWAADGFPIYGPYGYDDPNNPGSAVRRMIPGYAKRSITNRTTLPQWAADFQNKSASLPANEYGPPVNATYIIGHYIEDYEFLGTGDLDLYNGRTCITPEFPTGTYAYFVTIEADGTPSFPYAIGREYYGNPTGGTVNNINEAVTIQFEGGPEKSLTFDQSAPNSNDLTLTWSVVEGGQYVIESSTTLRDDSWVREVTDAVPTGDKLNLTDTGALVTNSQKFYRAR
ncbi:YHYH protein, partial [bacterium]|nr:YHYH protein [bacterium]